MSGSINVIVMEDNEEFINIVDTYISNLNNWLPYLLDIDINSYDNLPSNRYLSQEQVNNVRVKWGGSWNRIQQEILPYKDRLPHVNIQLFCMSSDDNYSNLLNFINKTTSVEPTYLIADLNWGRYTPQDDFLSLDMRKVRSTLRNDVNCQYAEHVHAWNVLYQFLSKGDNFHILPATQGRISHMFSTLPDLMAKYNNSCRVIDSDFFINLEQIVVMLFDLIVHWHRYYMASPVARLRCTPACFSEGSGVKHDFIKAQDTFIQEIIGGHRFKVYNYWIHEGLKSIYNRGIEISIETLYAICILSDATKYTSKLVSEEIVTKVNDKGEELSIPSRLTNSHLIRTEEFDFAEIFLQFIDKLFEGGDLSITLDLRDRYLCIQSSLSFTSSQNNLEKSFYDKVNWHLNEYINSNSWQSTQHTTALSLAQCIYHGKWQFSSNNFFNASIDNSAPFLVLVNDEKLYFKWKNEYIFYR
jgi:hypothetical protein